ncbi:hypothetical protein ACSS6W_004974 [Trichoderma asperelloides]
MEEETTATREATTPQEAKSTEPDDTSQLPPLVPRRVQELRNPRSRPRKSFKSRARERIVRDRHRSPSPPRWRLEVISTLESSQSFSTRVKVLRILDRIPELKDHVPQIVSSNTKLRSYTVRFTRCELVSLECEARRSQLSYSRIQGFKHQLYGFVKLMYQSGVRYNLYPRNIFLYTPFQRESTRQLFLGSVEDSDLVDAAEPSWNEYRKHVWDHINRVFALVEIWTYQDEAIDLMAAVDRDKDVVESLIEDRNAIIDAARADANEARIIMADTVEVFNKALTNIKQLEALSKNIMCSIRDPILVWDDAQSRKEVVEKNLKKIEVLGYRTNALIQKYSDPTPKDGANSVDISPQSIDEPEETRNTPVCGARAEENVTIPVGELMTQDEEIIIYDEEKAEAEAVVGNIGSQEGSSRE